jgi:hypothetical protein
MLAISAVVAGGALSPARADFTTVDISSYLNGNISNNPQLDPVGLGYGNTGTGILFQTYAYGDSGYIGSAFLAGQSSPGSSTELTIDLSGQNITGQSSFYALLNNYYGQMGVNEYNVVLNFANGASETYSSIGGVDTRDYNENPITSNSISDTTTNWWTDEAVTGSEHFQRLDVREFTIAPEYQDQTLTSFQIIQLEGDDPAFLSGLTFSTDPAASLVPEPASILMLGAGAFGAGILRRRKR